MKIKSSIFLALTAVIFGVTFVAQDEASNHIGPFTFGAVRFAVGAGFLLLLCLSRDLFYKKTGRTLPRTDLKALFIGGGLCGAALFGATLLQQLGFSDPNMTSGKSGFLSAMYILIVPLLGLFFKKRAGLFVWIGIGLALVGLYFLCLFDGFALSWGDGVVLGCAFMIAVHILLCDRFAGKADGLYLSCVQCTVAALLFLPPMLAAEQSSLPFIGDAILPVLFCGILSTGVAYTLQILGQKDANPTVASVIMSFESVVAVVAGAIILAQIPTYNEIIGCCLIFAAIVLAQLPSPKRKTVEEKKKDPQAEEKTEENAADEKKKE